ncbi:molybdate ABC transporter substrate-binding protein [Agromyces subbeticus]|uniref:molybdate ABC transporter substrate-binding protein n=1 Tax=Agromyces subbeticus TaxID=293890 RepID=UPI0003B30B21|nr:molybdate ABC transporter substrate-binding protein [Agromyces subbeticus]
MTKNPTRTLLSIAALAALALSGCAAGADGTGTDSSAAPTETAPELTGELTIFAAASLGAAFDELAAEFETLHPEVDVLPISYDGSSVLATQLIEGAHADVFASADEKNMTKVVDADLVTDSPVDFATNVLEIAVAPENPLGIDSLDDLADGATTSAGQPAIVVLCAPEVPCGAAARTLITNDGIMVTPASEEQNVSAVLTKVRTGEADAGLVYVTDIEGASGDVDGIEIDGAEAATNVYPIVSLAGSSNASASAAFVDFVASDAGQRVLASFGFGAP